MAKRFTSLNVPAYLAVSKQVQTQSPSLCSTLSLKSSFVQMQWYQLAVALGFPTPFVPPASKRSFKGQRGQAFLFFYTETCSTTKKCPQEGAHPAACLPDRYYSVSSFVLLFVYVYVRSRALTNGVDVTPPSANDSGNHS